MRFLLITRKWPPAVGGMETWSVEVADALRALGHTVDARALPGRPGGRAPSGGSILRFGLVQGASLLVARWREGSPQAVIGGDMAVWPLAWLAGRRSGATVIVAAHGTDLAFAWRRGLLGALYRAWLRLGARALRDAAILANSRATARRARELGFRKVTHAPLGVTVATGAPRAEPEPYLLFAGRLIRRKGLSWFVREILPALPEPLRLKVAGPPWDESEGAALDHPRVDALGPRPQAELHSLMARAVAVVVPNLPSERHVFEGFGLVAPEAAAAGAVVLASDLDGLSDAVLDGRTGFLLPAGDAAAWRAKLSEIAAWPPSTRLAATTEARDTAQAHFRWSAVAERIVALATVPRSTDHGDPR
ncbi:MAG: glycosyltransferase family 4 protein [Pseudomonadota bacterium]